MRKFGGVLVAAAMVLSVGLIAAPVDAATGPQCGALSTKLVGTVTTATLSKCTPTAATGGGGSGTFKAAKGATSGTLTISLTWAGGHGTSKGTIKFGPAKGASKCKSGSTLLAVTGSVTGGTGTAVKTIKAGQKISALVCLPKTGSETLEPGTVFAFSSIRAEGTSGAGFGRPPNRVYPRTRAL